MHFVGFAVGVSLSQRDHHLSDPPRIPCVEAERLHTALNQRSHGMKRERSDRGSPQEHQCRYAGVCTPCQAHAGVKTRGPIKVFA